MKVALPLSVLFLLAACEPVEPQTAHPPQAAAFDQALGRMDFARTPDVAPEDIGLSVPAALTSVLSVIGAAEDWREADALAQAAIERAEPGVERDNVEQALAKLMLTGYLIPHASEERVADLALEHAGRLVRHRSPEADAVLVTVQAFEGSWSRADVNRIALGAADAAEAYVAASAPCEECEFPAEARRALAESGRSADLADARRLEAARRLRALVE